MGDAAAAPARRVRRGARLRRRDARGPGRVGIRGCARRASGSRSCSHAACRRSGSASACSCSRARPAAWVGPLEEPEIGWYDVELHDAGAADPVLGSLPARFEAFQWHYYTYGVPAGAVELARSAACTQAFRLGDACWGVQFHPEVTAAQLDGWLADTVRPAAGPGAAPRRDAVEDRPLERARPHALRRVPRRRRSALARPRRMTRRPSSCAPSHPRIASRVRSALRPDSCAQSVTARPGNVPPPAARNDVEVAAHRRVGTGSPRWCCSRRSPPRRGRVQWRAPAVSSRRRPYSRSAYFALARSPRYTAARRSSARLSGGARGSAPVLVS